MWLLDNFMTFIIIICNEFNVVYPSWKTGQVTKSQNHTISILSWQGCAQFGFEIEKIHFGEFAEKLHISLSKHTLHHVC